MTWESVGNLALDTLVDSLKILGFAFVLYVILSFFEDKIASLLEKKKKYGPLFGALSGAIPQCGISVVGADLYTKRHLTMGTLIAIFIACSDEALPIFFGSFNQPTWYMVFPLLAIKIAGGALIGFAVDLFARKDEEEVAEHLDTCEGENAGHIGCCGHEIEGEGKWHEHLIHPLVHSLKIFLYAYVVSFLFGLMILGVGEDNFTNFLTSNYYLSPLYAVLIGLIPNCASSVLISDLYLQGGLPFGALVAGLAVNAGLGPLYLFKGKKSLKEALLIMGILIVSALALGYAFIWVH
jgi:hypothetical protein